MKFKYVILLLGVFLLFGGFVAYVYNMPLVANLIRGTELAQPAEPASDYALSKQTGYIYLTLTPLDTTDTNGYVYNVASKSLSNMNAEGQFSALYDVNTPTNERVYMTTGRGKDAPLVIQLNNTKTDESEYVVELDKQLLQPPRLSKSGRMILYTTLNDSADDNDASAQPESANIYVATKDAGVWTSTLLTSGSSPQWVGESAFYYLKNDGLYKGVLTSVSLKDTYLTNAPVDILSINSRIDVSDDYQYFLWSLPDIEKVYVFSIASPGKEDRLSSLATINQMAFWAKFSPNGRNIALQTARSSTLVEDPHPEMIVYNIDNNYKITRYAVLPLYPFKQTAMFITDWE